MDESAEGQSISERCAHVADGHISVSIALNLTPLLKRLDSRHPLQTPLLTAKTREIVSFKLKSAFVRRNNGALKKMTAEKVREVTVKESKKELKRM